jgi:hypothetical protein
LALKKQNADRNGSDEKQIGLHWTFPVKRRKADIFSEKTQEKRMAFQVE